ncbi:MAG: cell division protein ZapA [Lamprocystis purpurea]|uniref:cell division protein ZapA n=1 Tax=Lamprocystis purpurea TaxID=61598 RepID=UPI00036F8ADD|nr:cell division protein ZapA [Lamprocystis purpurea]MBV5274804.1 cell division protein ZapA [Lamprocystis purpurea]
MTEQPIGVDIKILDKDYRIACPAEEQNELLASARFLDSRMREIRQTGRVIGTDRIAVLAALNIVHELLQVQNGQPGLDSDLARRLARLEERIGEALSAEAGLDSSPERV